MCVSGAVRQGDEPARESASDGAAQVDRAGVNAGRPRGGHAGQVAVAADAVLALRHPDDRRRPGSAPRRARCPVLDPGGAGRHVLHDVLGPGLQRCVVPDLQRAAEPLGRHALLDTGRHERVALDNDDPGAPAARRTLDALLPHAQATAPRPAGTVMRMHMPGKRHTCAYRHILPAGTHHPQHGADGRHLLAAGGRCVPPSVPCHHRVAGV